jgi:hypothetical protein
MLPAAELRGIPVFNFDYFLYMPLDPALKGGACAARSGQITTTISGGLE